MALIWAEGFDHYGDGSTGDEGRTFMLQGAWAQFSSGNGPGAKIQASNARTGTCCLRFPFNSLATDSAQARRVLGAAHLVVGCATGIYFGGLPAVNKEWGFEFRNNSNNAIVFIAVQSDGAIAIYTGSARTFYAASDPIITAASWQHIEARIVCDDIVGAVEVRVNGITVLNETDMNLGVAGCTQMVFGMPAGKNGGGSLNVDYDDIVTWNDSGDFLNSFIGACRVETVFPDGDTAQADWGITGAATGHEAIDDNPRDSDTTFISSDVATEISEFTLPTLPPETANIKGVYIPVMAKLFAAGTGNIQVSLVSGAAVSLGPDQTLTTAYTYWGGSHEIDPDTGAPWTKEGLEAALLRVEKTV